MNRKRVVVTGMGIASPIGNSVKEAWDNAARGMTGIGPITRFDASTLENRFGGEVKDFDAEAIFGRREARRMDRFTQLAVYSTQQALESAGFEINDHNRYDVAVVIGTGIGGIATLVTSVQKFYATGAHSVSPLMVPMMLPDSAAGKVSMVFGVRGPNFAISTACATGNNCIGEAAEIIRRGQANVAIAGSSEAALEPVTIAGFNNMHAISRRNDAPERASRPFDADRDGFVVSEGAAMLILEDYDHAVARGATIIAEILGYGHTSDAYHVTAPMDTGESASEAMQRALHDASLTVHDIDYINAHGTSTPLNDKSETLAIKRTFGEHAYEIPISSTKSVTGHLMGSAGSVEAVLTIEAMRHNFVPPTINYETPDPDCDLNYTPNEGTAHTINKAMSNSFGFGGHNAVMIFGKHTQNGHA